MSTPTSFKLCCACIDSNSPQGCKAYHKDVCWYDWSERATIREFCGGMDREEAERKAMEDLRK